MDRRTFLGILVAALMALLPVRMEAAQPRTVTMRFKATAGESLAALVARNGYKVNFSAVQGFSDKFLSELLKPRRNNPDAVIMRGPVWKPSPEKPDDRIPRGWPCLTWQKYVRDPNTRRWKWVSPPESPEKATLGAGEKVRFILRGFDPRLAF